MLNILTKWLQKSSPSPEPPYVKWIYEGTRIGCKIGFGEQKDDDIISIVCLLAATSAIQNKGLMQEFYTELEDMLVKQPNLEPFISALIASIISYESQHLQQKQPKNTPLVNPSQVFTMRKYNEN